MASRCDLTFTPSTQDVCFPEPFDHPGTRCSEAPPRRCCFDPRRAWPSGLMTGLSLHLSKQRTNLCLGGCWKAQSAYFGGVKFHCSSSTMPLWAWPLAIAVRVRVAPREAKGLLRLILQFSISVRCGSKRSRVRHCDLQLVFHPTLTRADC